MLMLRLSGNNRPSDGVMFAVYEYVLVQGGYVAVFEAFRVDAKRRICMVQLPPEFDIPLDAWRRG